MKNHYRVLEVSPNSSEEVIKAAYFALAKKHKSNEKHLKELNAASEVLLDRDERAKYDLTLERYEGKVIGQYRVLDVIEEGGFGRTYRGEHVNLGTPVCIKHAHRISSEDELILLEEAKSIWDLRHYGIPAIRDILKMPDGSIALVMSYIPGPNLGQLVDKTKHKRIDPEHVAWITERILNILKYLHFHGVVHGDVKPQNIIVQPESHTVVLVDYGLSAIRPSSTADNKGYTPYFASPEQQNGGILLPESDFYGLGMTMIFALGGDIQSKEVPSDVPDGMCDFLTKLIRHDVLARPNWEREDLVESLQKVRQSDFGRKASGMKPLRV